MYYMHGRVNSLLTLIHADGMSVAKNSTRLGQDLLNIIFNVSIYTFIIHQIFSLACDWSKRITWANNWGISEDIPQFLKPMDNKHNSLNLAAKICSDICPWTLSVPRGSQFSSSFALGKLFASRNR